MVAAINSEYDIAFDYDPYLSSSNSNSLTFLNQSTHSLLSKRSTSSHQVHSFSSKYTNRLIEVKCQRCHMIVKV
ncbi:hypothetical protein QVD17_10904 [Tagetes erecta]|uniref:Uncharacterized protein n=1 Tax=Tagetes erecta TaxID=13708 RepID=A0AAD8L7G3_TARER|nr:hypothetical protein QVD17_10904 [Tagetes erecta]